MTTRPSIDERSQQRQKVNKDRRRRGDKKTMMMTDGTRSRGEGREGKRSMLQDLKPNHHKVTSVLVFQRSSSAL